jgi:acetyl esterase/lipase
MVGDADALLGQAQTLAETLEKAGVPHEHVVWPGMPHAFTQMEMFPAARESIDRMVEFLRKHL